MTAYPPLPEDRRDPIPVPPDLFDPNPGQLRSLPRWAFFCMIVLTAAFFAVVVSMAALIQALNQAESRATEAKAQVLDLQSQLTCRGALTRKVTDAQSKLFVELGDAISAILAADRQALAANAPLLKQASTDLQNATAELNRTDQVCTSSQPPSTATTITIPNTLPSATTTAPK